METVSIEKLDALSPDVILSAKDKYHRFCQDKQASLNNPTTITDEINYKKEVYSNLKFQYLEQETREKFLRSILSNPPLYVEQSDIDAKIEQNSETKQDLKALKRKMEELQTDSKDMAREAVALYEEFQDKAQKSAKYVEEIESMEKEISELTTTHPILIDLANIANETTLEDIQTGLNKEKNEQEIKLLKLNREFELKQELVDSQTRSIINLQNKVKELNEDLNNNQNSQEITKDQLLAQWLKEINEIWIKLSNFNNLSIEFIQDYTYNLKVDKANSNVTIQINFVDFNNCDVINIKSEDGKDYSSYLNKIETYKGIQKIGKLVELVALN